MTSRDGALVPMVLAAGLATRLRPLTQDRAKGTVPFLNRPLLDYTFEWLARSGFDRAVVNLHHAPDSIVELYGRCAFGLEVHYSHEPELLGTAGGPRAALDRLGERALIVNGDVVTSMALGPLLMHHRKREAMATLALHTGPGADDYPHVAAAADGRLLGFPGDSVDETEVAVRGVFTGLHVVESAVLEAVPAGVACGIVDPVYRSLIESGLCVGAIPVPGAWYEVGTPQLYIDRQLESLRRESLSLAFDGLNRNGAGAYSSPHAHVENARPRPPYLLGAGSRIKQGAWVEASVIGDRGQVTAGARIDRSVLWPGAVVGAACRLRECIVMEGVAVAAGTVAERTIFAPGGAIAFDSYGAGPAAR